MIKRNNLHSTILFLAAMTAAASQQEETSIVNGTACSSIPFDTIPTLNGGKGYAFQLPFIEDCLASVQVNKENMLQHIRDLNETFAQSYQFYNVAKDPAASDPKEYQAELGYALFDTPEEGRVDINAELTSISKKVEEEEGATMATFWDIQSVFNRLRDGHVGMPETNADLGSGFLFFIPERCANGAVKGKHSFSNDPATGELQLKIHWEDGNGTKSESVVESMNGGSPYEFFLNVSNSPSIAGINHQSRGARFNALLMQIHQGLGFAQAFGDYSKVILPVKVNARPSAAYPPEVRVRYANGEEEMYRALLILQSDSLNNLASPTIAMNLTSSIAKFNVPIIQDHINKMGSAYDLVHQAVKNATTAFSINRASPPTKKEDVNVVGNVEKDHFWFQTYPSDKSPMIATKIMNGYAIFKIESFHNLDRTEVIGEWIALSTKCKETGVKKLIVDISNNGGGRVISAQTLATLMYPNAAYDWYRRNLAVVINKPMQIYRDMLEPEFDLVSTAIKSNDVDEVLQLDVIDKLLPDYRIKQVNATIEILKKLCFEMLCEKESGLGLVPCGDPKCGDLEVFQRSWEHFATDKSPPLLRRVISDMIDLMKEFDRFGALQHMLDFNETIVQDNPSFEGFMIFLMKEFHRFNAVQEMDFNETIVRTVNQGGVLTNLTSPFTLFTEELYSMAVANALQNDPGFDEYIVVSNGVAGSASAIFASEVEQLWKNRDRSLVKTKLTTVSYGGLKEDNGDVTMAGFPATTEKVHIEDTFITSGVALLLDFLIPENATSLLGFSSALDKYYQSLAVPPYYANTLPQMPVIGYYDSFMGPDAIPLQYVKMPADKHIPSYYFGTTIQDNSDLEELYKKTAEFFSSDLAAGAAGDEGKVENSDALGGNASTSENGNSEEGSGSNPETAPAPSSIAAARISMSGLVGVVAVVAAAAVLFSVNM